MSIEMAPGESAAQYTNEELVDALREAAEEVGHTPTRTEFEDLDGYPSSGTYYNRFES